jgi:hypothetical protein
VATRDAEGLHEKFGHGRRRHGRLRLRRDRDHGTVHAGIVV